MTSAHRIPARIPSRAHWFRFDVPVHPDLAKHLVAFAGPVEDFKLPGTFWVPSNCAWLVSDFLKKYAVPFQVYAPEVQARPLTAMPAVPDAKPGTLESLLEFQNEGIAYKMNMRGAAFWWGPGAGKTRPALVYIKGCIRRGRQQLGIFVTRAGARETIRGECTRLFKTPPYVIEGAGRFDEAKARAAGLVITAWETLQIHVDQLLDLAPFSLVLDEAHRGKSHEIWTGIEGEDGKTKFGLKGNRASALYMLARASNRTLATTATPVYNRLDDLWPQLDAIDPGSWGKRIDWCVRYCSAYRTPYGYDTGGRSNEAELAQRLSGGPVGDNCDFPVHKVPYSRSHGQLPPKIREVILVTREQQNRGGAFTQEFRKARKKDHKSVVEIKLAEACSRKRKWLVEDILENLGTNGKIAVFSARKKDANDLAEALQNARKELKVWCAHGDHSDEIRDQVLREYMGAGTEGDEDYIPRHPGPCVVVGTHDAYGESVNMQDTDVAYVAMLPVNGGKLIQVEGRVSRQGQERRVRIRYPVAQGTIDEHMAELLLDKLPSMETIAGDEQIGGVLKALSNNGLTDEAIEESMMNKILNWVEPEEET
jgi:hypothetical protein